MMMWLQLFIVIAALYLHESFAQKAHVTCERDYKKIGCFKTKNDGKNRVDYDSMQMLLNDREVNSPYHDGYLLNWRQFAESTHSLACRCAAKAKKEGYTYISIRYWGECHGGKDYTAVENLLKKSNEGTWRSSQCVNPKFGKCVNIHEDECVGTASADYIYQVGISTKEEKIDGGFASWSKWSDCSATCGSNLIQERERVCTNPLPQGSGKSCEGDFTQTQLCSVSECPIYNPRKYEYTFNTTSHNYADAEKKCKESGMHLATIESEAEINYIVSQINLLETSENTFWIGLDDIENEGRWKWIDGSTSTYRHWSENEPNGNRNENCVHIVLKEGTFNDLSCTATLPGFICRKDVYDHRNYEYTFNATGSNYADAEKKCQASGMHLATIESQAEINYIVSQINLLSTSKNTFWIGLDDIEKEGRWKWIDGSTSTYRHWSENEPNGNLSENCVHIVLKEGTFNDLSCTATRPGFICRKDK